MHSCAFTIQFMLRSHQRSYLKTDYFILKKIYFIFFFFPFFFLLYKKIENIKVVIQGSTGLHYLKAHLSHFPRFRPVCHSESPETNQVPRLPTV